MFLEMRTSRYNLFALVLLWWGWVLFKEIGRFKQAGALASRYGFIFANFVGSLCGLAVKIFNRKDRGENPRERRENL
jgi:hypothetical protein